MTGMCEIRTCRRNCCQVAHKELRKDACHGDKQYLNRSAGTWSCVPDSNSAIIIDERINGYSNESLFWVSGHFLRNRTGGVRGGANISVGLNLFSHKLCDLQKIYCIVTIFGRDGQTAWYLFAEKSIVIAPSIYARIFYSKRKNTVFRTFRVRTLRLQLRRVQTRNVLKIVFFSFISLSKILA